MCSDSDDQTPIKQVNFKNWRAQTFAQKANGYSTVLKFGRTRVASSENKISKTSL